MDCCPIELFSIDPNEDCISLEIQSSFLIRKGNHMVRYIINLETDPHQLDGDITNKLNFALPQLHLRSI